jgi:hypothetical protein
MIGLSEALFRSSALKRMHDNVKCITHDVVLLLSVQSPSRIINLQCSSYVKVEHLHVSTPQVSTL